MKTPARRSLKAARINQAKLLNQRLAKKLASHVKSLFPDGKLMGVAHQLHRMPFAVDEVELNGMSQGDALLGRHVVVGGRHGLPGRFHGGEIGLCRRLLNHAGTDFEQSRPQGRRLVFCAPAHSNISCSSSQLSENHRFHRRHTSFRQ